MVRANAVVPDGRSGAGVRVSVEAPASPTASSALSSMGAAILSVLAKAFSAVVTATRVRDDVVVADSTSIVVVAAMIIMLAASGA